jgi:hypothetical protein
MDDMAISYSLFAYKSWCIRKTENALRVPSAPALPKLPRCRYTLAVQELVAG